jgi:two-component system OmpR family sensor kinase
VSIRNRIIVMVLILMACAVVAADLVTSSEVHQFLIGRLDDQLSDEQSQLLGYIKHVYAQQVGSEDSVARTDPVSWLESLDASTLSRSKHPSGANHAAPGLSQEGLSSHIAPDDFVELIDTDRNMVYEHATGPQDSPGPLPLLPEKLRPETGPVRQKLGQFKAGDPAFSVGSVGSLATQYRVEAASVPGGVLVIAASSAPSQSTFESLVHTEILVSIVVILVLTILVGWTVRISLRPLEDMTETADSFAKGDLSRRVRFASRRTEVGRLGGALNGMLVQIESALKQRQDSEARLRRFVADASHDLRTPLTSIRGYAELLRKGAFTEEDDRRRALRRVEHEAERMAVLVDDLLLLARLDQGRPVVMAPVELRPLVADAVAAARAADSSHPITLGAPYGVLVKGDSHGLRQAADNLIRNAVEHTPAGTPISVAITAIQGAVRVSVSDTGPGVRADQLDRIFERFFQSDPARTGRGTGLGLSIVVAIAEAHGGRAWVESVEGDGATFFIELPLHESDSGSDTGSGPELEREPEGEPAPASTV